MCDLGFAMIYFGTWILGFCARGLGQRAKSCAGCVTCIGPRSGPD